MSYDNDKMDAVSNPGPGLECPDFAEIVRGTTPDRSLFEQITACFSDRLESFARYYCRDDTLGKDAFQDAMVAAMRHIETYRGDSPVEAWLRKIVVSACARQRRGQKNSSTVNVPFETEKGALARAAEAPSQELRMMLKERLEMVQREMERLKEPNRTLLMLHDIEEVPVASLMERFELTEESVKSRLKRARAEVRQGLIKREKPG